MKNRQNQFGQNAHQVERICWFVFFFSFWVCRNLRMDPFKVDLIYVVTFLFFNRLEYFIKCVCHWIWVCVEMNWCQLNVFTKGVWVRYCGCLETKGKPVDPIKLHQKKNEMKKKKLFDVLFSAFMISEFVSRKTYFLEQMWHCFRSTPQIELSVWLQTVSTTVTTFLQQRWSRRRKERKNSTQILTRHKIYHLFRHRSVL